MAEQLGRQLFESLFGQGGVSLAGASGGSPVGIGGFLSSLFGGERLAGAGVDANADITMVKGASSGGFFVRIASWFFSLPALAFGTIRVPQDMLAIIHEDKIVVPKYDADRMRAGGFAQESTHVHNNFTVAGNVTRETQSQIAYKAWLGVSRVSRRNG